MQTLGGDVCRDRSITRTSSPAGGRPTRVTAPTGSSPPQRMPPTSPASPLASARRQRILLSVLRTQLPVRPQRTRAPEIWCGRLVGTWLPNSVSDPYWAGNVPGQRRRGHAHQLLSDPRPDPRRRRNRRPAVHPEYGRHPRVGCRPHHLGCQPTPRLLQRVERRRVRVRAGRHGQRLPRSSGLGLRADSGDHAGPAGHRARGHGLRGDSPHAESRRARWHSGEPGAGRVSGCGGCTARSSRCWRRSQRRLPSLHRR